MDTRFWNGKRVFVTGATGLLGSQLTRMLIDAGANVTILLYDQDPNSPLVQSPAFDKVFRINGALQDYNLLLRAITSREIEYVFHLGAQTQVTHANSNPLEAFESNIRGTYNVLEACRVYGKLKGIVVASSDKAYGDQKVLPYTEDAPLQGCHPYDVSKSCTDLLSHTYFVSYKLPVCVTRCGNIYGPGDMNFARILPDALRCMHLGTMLELRSDGTLVRDYIFVEDAADGYLTIAEQMHRPEIVGQAFNISTKNKLSVIDLLKALERATGKPVKYSIKNTAVNEIKDQYLESTKAKTLLGWEPKHAVEDGLRKTADAYFAFFKNGHWRG